MGSAHEQHCIALHATSLQLPTKELQKTEKMTCSTDGLQNRIHLCELNLGALFREGREHFPEAQSLIRACRTHYRTIRALSKPNNTTLMPLKICRFDKRWIFP